MFNCFFRRIRAFIIFFMIVLALSGITAFPVYTELKFLHEHPLFPQGSALQNWLERVWAGVKEANDKHPFLFYGFDWLAFAHLLIALLFIGPYKDPVRNKWVINWGILACLAVLPLAIIAGPIRGIPWFPYPDRLLVRAHRHYTITPGKAVDKPVRNRSISINS
jgi:hypothetical protein